MAELLKKVEPGQVLGPVSGPTDLRQRAIELIQEADRIKAEYGYPVPTRVYVPEGAVVVDNTDLYPIFSPLPGSNLEKLITPHKRNPAIKDMVYLEK